MISHIYILLRQVPFMKDKVMLTLQNPIKKYKEQMSRSKHSAAEQRQNGRK